MSSPVLKKKYEIIFYNLDCKYLILIWHAEGICYNLISFKILPKANIKHPHYFSPVDIKLNI